MNVKLIKTPKCFPYTKYTDSSPKNKIKVKVCLYEDLGGMIECKSGKSQFFVQENGNLNDWKKKVEELIKEHQVRAKQLEFTLSCLNRIIKKHNNDYNQTDIR